MDGLLQLPLFPNPLPDETLFSIYCRYHAVSGNAQAEDTRLQLTGHAAEGFRRRPPTTLLELQERLPQGIFPTYEDFLVRYTLYPYFFAIGRFPIRPRRLASNLEEWLAVFPEVSVDDASSSVSKRKFCPKCVLEDLNLYGVAYWHRIHQPDECVICCKHLCRLVWTCPFCGAAYRVDSELYLPSLTCPAGHEINPESQMFIRNVLDTELITARWCEAFTRADLFCSDYRALEVEYLVIMRERGWKRDAVDGAMTHRGKHYAMLQIRKFWGLERYRRLPLNQRRLFPAGNAPCLRDSITAYDVSTNTYGLRHYGREASWLTNLWIVGYLLGSVERIKELEQQVRAANRSLALIEQAEHDYLVSPDRTWHASEVKPMAGTNPNIVSCSSPEASPDETWPFAWRPA